MLEKIFSIIWLIVAGYDVLETFVFPKFLGEENEKIDRKFSKELAQDFLDLQSIASANATKKIIVSITVFSALIPLTGFFIAYNSGIFSGVYEKILYAVIIIALLDIIYTMSGTIKLIRGFSQKKDLNDLTNDLLKLGNKDAILHILASAGIFIISFRLAIDLLFHE